VQTRPRIPLGGVRFLVLSSEIYEGSAYPSISRTFGVAPKFVRLVPISLSCWTICRGATPPRCERGQLSCRGRPVRIARHATRLFWSTHADSGASACKPRPRPGERQLDAVKGVMVACCREMPPLRLAQGLFAARVLSLTPSQVSHPRRRWGSSPAHSSNFSSPLWGIRRLNQRTPG